MSFVTYNVEGLSCLYDSETRSYLSKFDICLLVETFSATFRSHLFPLYDVFIVSGVKLTDAVTARLSGGVALLVKKQWSKNIERVHVEFDNLVVMKLSADFLGTDTHVLLIGGYVPPISSGYYKDTDIYNGITILEQCIMDMMEEFGNVPFILLGDFNARTGNECPECDEMNYAAFDLLDTDEEVVFVQQRVSKDTEVNEFGRYLLNVCEQFDFQILNGVARGDKCGNFTYVSPTGCSVIDYFIVSRNLLSLSLLLNVNCRIESKHMPVELSIELLSDKAKPTVTRNMSKLDKYVWNTQDSGEFMTRLSATDVKNCFDEATELLEVDINRSLSRFTDGLHMAGTCMKKSVTIGKDNSQSWFDAECRENRKRLRQRLRAFHKSNLVEDRILYNEKRKEYKQLLNNKKTAHRTKLLDSLQQNINDPKTFWSKLKSCISKAPSTNSISTEQWFQHFSNVFSKDNSHNTNTDETCFQNSDDIDAQGNEEQSESEDVLVNNDVDIESLECDISEAEVYAAIRALKNGKAAGPDRLTGNFF